MKIYNFYFYILLNIATVSFASEEEVKKAPFKSLLTLMIEEGIKNGTFIPDSNYIAPQQQNKETVTTSTIINLSEKNGSPKNAYSASKTAGDFLNQNLSEKERFTAWIEFINNI